MLFRGDEEFLILNFPDRLIREAASEVRQVRDELTDAHLGGGFAQFGKGCQQFLPGFALHGFARPRTGPSERKLNEPRRWASHWLDPPYSLSKVEPHLDILLEPRFIHRQPETRGVRHRGRAVLAVVAFGDED